MKTAIVLSGGGSRGDFQVGAIKYLYDHGIWPDIIFSSSVGSINGIKLAACSHRSKGIACYVFDSPAQDRNPLYRLNNGINRLYTTSEIEKTDAINNFGYSDEGITCYVFDKQVEGTVPLFRLNSDTNFLFTTSVTERDFVINLMGYSDQGITCWVYSLKVPETTELFRLVNPA
jgi:hypothetical protein